MNPTFTREVNGNSAIRLGDELRDLYDAGVGDYVTIEVKAVHPQGETLETDGEDK